MSTGKETPKREQQEALRKAELILKVRSGQLSAQEAARQLGVSRKTYYKWEKRALEGMLEGLCERNSGRPGSALDEEKEQLKEEIRKMGKELEMMRQSEEIRALLKGEAEKKE